ncbi:NUDIX hydrolase [Roseomonas gilardii subsp. gilardii]|uniref:NUDIX hydrolase n=1 Tax=Roseomonas gilardii TaxID=257708 RepID=UPI001FF8AE8F|nr:NUDIX hydrolase [Roseomonas gilardii]UPG72098.1 NUDIX hydrolase [Roseomonas gilardii subsp. gilardii]
MPHKLKKRLGRQYAALPIAQQAGETVVMLVTSRDTHRWILPKGWAEKNMAPHELAAKEAYEEAGLVGEVLTEAVGSYSYNKRLRSGREVPCRVQVFPMRVERQLEDWPERQQRETRWFTLDRAARMVGEDGLSALLLGLMRPQGSMA